MAMSVHMQSYN